MMLTDDEIDKLGAGNNYPGTVPGMLKFARAIIAAYQAKLLAGVEWPVKFPAGHASIRPFVHYDVALQYGDSRDQAGYLRGLEDAKRVCEELMAPHEFSRHEKSFYEVATLDCAAAIEKLKGGE